MTAMENKINMQNLSGSMSEVIYPSVPFKKVFHGNGSSSQNTLARIFLFSVLFKLDTK